VEVPEEDCLLCSLIEGRMPTSRVYEDGLVVVFMDFKPVNPGHLLVVPRHHAALLDDLDEELSVAMYRIGHRMSRALRRSGLRCEAVNLFIADARPRSKRFRTHICTSSRATMETRFASTQIGLSENGVNSTRRRGWFEMAWWRSADIIDASES